ncbi:hypothetical protein LXL04_004905 [Taraxacum kok-saghyz]
MMIVRWCLKLQIRSIEVLSSDIQHEVNQVRHLQQVKSGQAIYSITWYQSYSLNSDHNNSLPPTTTSGDFL